MSSSAQQEATALLLFVSVVAWVLPLSFPTLTLRPNPAILIADSNNNSFEFEGK
jgi:hypothetical protein